MISSHILRKAMKVIGERIFAIPNPSASNHDRDYIRGNYMVLDNNIELAIEYIESSAHTVQFTEVEDVDYPGFSEGLIDSLESFVRNQIDGAYLVRSQRITETIQLRYTFLKELVNTIEQYQNIGDDELIDVLDI